MAAEDYIDIFDLYDDEYWPHFNDQESDSGWLTNDRRWSPPPSVCPRCNSPLVVRTNRTTGEDFTGCSKFPVCRFSCSGVPEKKKPTPRKVGGGRRKR